jgi:hypothetical protein
MPAGRARTQAILPFMNQVANVISPQLVPIEIIANKAMRKILLGDYSILWFCWLLFFFRHTHIYIHTYTSGRRSLRTSCKSFQSKAPGRLKKCTIFGA